MNTEQKAEAYDKALKNMRKFRDALNNHEETDLWVLKKEIVTDIEYYFPELKENGDKQMWKLIKKYVHNNISDTVFNADHITRDQLESWLEKQGKQKTIWHNEDEEPKRGSIILLIMQNGTPTIAKIIEPNHSFNHGEKWAYIDDLLEKQSEQPQSKTSLEAINEEKVDNQNCVKLAHKVGDWIVGNDGIFKITQYEDKYGYELTDTTGGIVHFISPDYVESNFNIWTLKDAKPGEVLVTDNGRPFIFKGCLDKMHPNNPVAYCGIDCDNNFYVANGIGWWTNENVYPATEEQCRFLFQKIHESGFKWDANKKELKKIEQNPTWSEDDEWMLNEVINAVIVSDYAEGRKEMCIDWLKSVKEKHTWKPSDKQMDALAWALSLSKNCGEDCAYDLGTLQDQLKKLK